MKDTELLATDRAVFGLDWDKADPVVEIGLDPDAAPAYVAYCHQFEESHAERRRTGRSVSGIHGELTRGWRISPEFRHDFLGRFHLDAGGGMAHDVAPGAASWWDSTPRGRARSASRSARCRSWR